MMLEVKRLEAYYHRQILFDIHFSVKKGELVGIIGPNGCGKSTLLRALMGSIKTNGKVYVDGVDFYKQTIKQRAKMMTLLTQRFEAIAGICVLDVLNMGRYVQTPFFDLAHSNEKVIEMAHLFHIESLLEKDYASLSEGQKQLIQFVRILIQETNVILLDEPDSALDISHKEMIYTHIKNIVSHKACLMVLHDIVSALNHCDRILIMNHGCIIGEIKPNYLDIENITQQLRKIYPSIIIRWDEDYQQFYSVIGGEK